MKFKMCQGQEPQSNCRCVGGSLFEEMAHRSQYGRSVITKGDLHRYIGGTFTYMAGRWILSNGKHRYRFYKLSGKITGLEAEFPVIIITHDDLREKAPGKRIWKKAGQQLNDDDFVFVMNGWTGCGMGSITLAGDDPHERIVLDPRT